MLDLLHGTHRHPGRDSSIRLNREFRADLAWWKLFASSWNGTSFLPPPDYLPATDGCLWILGLWGLAWRCLVPGSVGREINGLTNCSERTDSHRATWGETWRGRQVTCHCDNQVVVAALRSRSSKQKGIMHLLRCLVFIEAHFNCHLRSSYINTKLNHLADDLSRNALPSFLSKVPSANHTPSPTSQPLLNLLLNPQADWISPHWHHQFNVIFRTV